MARRPAACLRKATGESDRDDRRAGSGRQMNEFDELRYPFDTLFDFVGGGYFAERAGLHLTIALIVFAILTMQVMLGRGTVVQKLITLFFAGTVYNNPAFAVPGGLHFNEIAGVVASLWLGGLLLG